MKKVTIKLVSLVLAVIMVASLAVPMSAVSASAAEGDTAASVKVYMTISDQGVIAKDKNGEAMAWKEVTATDLDKDGTVTFDEALVAAHEAYCADGKGGYVVSTSGWVTKLWGESGSYSFITNNVAGMDVVTETAVKDNDYLVASVNQDNSLYSDWNSYFDQYEATVSTEETVTLNLSGYLAMTINPPKAAEGVQIGVWEDGAFKAIDGAVTNESGNVDVSFDEPGTYIVTASGTASDIVDAAGLYVLMESTKDKNDKTIYGKMDWNTYDSWVGYTEKDYGEGPYPWNEVKWIDLEDFDADEFDAGYLLYSGNVLNDCPLIVPCCIVTVEDKVELEDGAYTLPELSAGPSSMFNHFVDDSKYLIVDGDKATVRFITDGSTASVQKYSRIALGKSSELVTSEYQPDSDLPEGTTIIDGVLQPKDDAGVDKYLFEIPLSKEEAEALLANDVAEDIYITVWNNVGSSTEKIPGWYKASKDIYLSLGSLGEKTEMPVVEPEKIDLAITNNTGMFKAVTAYVEKTGSNTELVMALSGTSYNELYKGTYEQAVANGDNRDNWIHGYTNEDGKVEFRIPIAEGDTYVPCVSISQTYLNKYEQGQNSLDRAFYPRQFELDLEAKTIVVGDYKYSQDLDVTNNVKMFKVDSAKLDTVGGPNSNNYKANLALTMGSDSFSKAFAGTAKEAAAAEKVIEIGEGRLFEIPVKWVETFGQPETMKTLIGEPFTMSFFSVKNESWYERIVTINETDGTLVIDPVLADYTAVDAALAKVPKDLSSYTKESSQAVDDAVAAVKRDLTSEKQAEVDAMAQAIEDAVIGLKKLTEFSDVTDPKTFYYTPVYWAVREGITTGWDNGTFRPWNDCNRAAVVTFLWRLAGKPEPTKTKAFSDMTGKAEFDKAILWASEEGITTGWDDGTFRPWNTCNRAAIVTFLWRYAGRPEPTKTEAFSDMTGNTEFDKAILWAAEEDITTGWDDGTFRPWNMCNRAAVVSFLYRYREQ